MTSPMDISKFLSNGANTNAYCLFSLKLYSKLEKS